MQLILALLLFCAGCGTDSEPDGDAAGGKIILKAGHSTNTDEPYHLGLLEMARIVNDKSGGRVQIQIYPAMQLGSEKAMLEGLLLGTLDIVVTANGSVTNFVPGMGILDLPFLFRSREHMYSVIDGEVGDQLRVALEDRGFHLLGYYEAGVRHIMTSHSRYAPCRYRLISRHSMHMEQAPSPSTTVNSMVDSRLGSSTVPKPRTRTITTRNSTKWRRTGRSSAG
jgi:TRAP-type C4-dicarboxylate transport system substrate-binding protein